MAWQENPEEVTVSPAVGRRMVVSPNTKDALLKCAAATNSAVVWSLSAPPYPPLCFPSIILEEVLNLLSVLSTCADFNIFYLSYVDNINLSSLNLKPNCFCFLFLFCMFFCLVFKAAVVQLYKPHVFVHFLLLAVKFPLTRIVFKKHSS